MHHPTDRITHTMAFVTPVVEHWLEREIAQWVVAVTDLVDYFSSTGKHFSKDTPIMWASVVEDHCGEGGFWGGVL